jgi:hypothetical protein
MASISTSEVCGDLSLAVLLKKIVKPSQNKNRGNFQ